MKGKLFNSMVTSPPHNFARVMNYPENQEKLYIFDFTQGYDPDFIRTKAWGIGRYNEKRSNMYVAPQYEDVRNIHMGIDIWTSPGSPVFSFTEGEVVYLQDNDQNGDYGPTIVIRYYLSDHIYFALYGHLSRSSLQEVDVGEQIDPGQQIAKIGTEEVNGGWAPHLHFQLAKEDPGEADMPGVVASASRAGALQQYPDPRRVLGNLY